MKKVTEEQLNLGSEAKLLSKSTQNDIQHLFNILPNESADAEANREYIKELNNVKQPLAKILKHLNRLQVIANTQALKARMRDHVDEQMNIFDFGVDPSKDQSGEAEK